MSATYGYAGADVTIETPGAEGEVKSKLFEHHSVLVRGGVAKLRTRAGILVAEKANIVRSERVDRNHWRTVFADGVVWEVVVSKAGCSSCG